jgi:hypothetical protein
MQMSKQEQEEQEHRKACYVEHVHNYVGHLFK